MNIPTISSRMWKLFQEDDLVRIVDRGFSFLTEEGKGKFAATVNVIWLLLKGSNFFVCPSKLWDKISVWSCWLLNYCLVLEISIGWLHNRSLQCFYFCLLFCFECFVWCFLPYVVVLCSHRIIIWESKNFIIRKQNYLPPVRDLGFFEGVALFFCFMVLPSFSVTTHWLTRFASRSPIIAAFVRWSDITFLSNIQNTTRWDLLA